MSVDDRPYFACVVYNPDDYPPRLRDIWDRDVAVMREAGLPVPMPYPDSQIGACEACQVRVSVGPRQTAKQLDLLAQGQYFHILCLLCARIAGQAEDVELVVHALGNPHDRAGEPRGNGDAR